MIKKRIDKNDIRIINELSSNSRARNTELASKIGLSEPPTLTRVKNLFQQHYILNPAAIPNYKQFGYKDRMLHAIKIPDEEATDFIQDAKNLRHIIKLNKIESHPSGIKTTSFMFETICKSSKHTEFIVSAILRKYTVFDYRSFSISATLKDNPLTLDENADVIK